MTDPDREKVSEDAPAQEESGAGYGNHAAEDETQDPNDPEDEAGEG